MIGYVLLPIPSRPGYQISLFNDPVTLQFERVYLFFGMLLPSNGRLTPLLYPLPYAPIPFVVSQKSPLSVPYDRPREHTRPLEILPKKKKKKLIPPHIPLFEIVHHPLLFPSDIFFSVYFLSKIPRSFPYTPFTMHLLELATIIGVKPEL